MKKFLLHLTLALLAPTIVFAQAPPLPPAPFSTIDELLGTGGIICGVFRYLFYILILIAVIFILLAAFRYATHGADPDQIKIANRQIAYAAVAVIIAFMARVIPLIGIGIVGGFFSFQTC